MRLLPQVSVTQRESWNQVNLLDFKVSSNPVIDLGVELARFDVFEHLLLLEAKSKIIHFVPGIGIVHHACVHAHIIFEHSPCLS
jgi:hypothetical protein